MNGTAQTGAGLPPLELGGGPGTPTRWAAYSPPRARRIVALVRALGWLGTWLRYWLGTRLEQLVGRDTPHRRADRMRRLIERRDPAAVRVARKLALRLDLLPLAMATELYRLRDDAPPMPLDAALTRVEQAVGGPVSETFQAFDPEPILADALSCVYQAQLQSGELVAVRVRRERVAQRLADEAAALSMLAGLARFVAPEHHDLLQAVRADLQPLLLQDLDFVRVGRLQVLFRRFAKRDRQRDLTAAKVLMRYTTADVLVSEFVGGVFLSEIHAALANDDTEALAMFTRLGIDPAKVGRRLLRGCWWQVFENLFFCQAPDPSRIVVQPGGRLVFVELGPTGRIGNKQRRSLLTALECFAEHDVEGGVEAILQVMQPLPYIDVHEYAKALESVMWTRIFAMENKRAQWWEHASTGLWMALFEINRRYDVTMRLNISRLFQTLVTVDHLAAGLSPELRVLRELRRYRRRAARRKARVGSRKLARESRRAPVDPADLLVQLQPALRRVAAWIEGAVEDVPVRYIALSRKGAWSASQAIWALVVGVQITAALYVVATLERLGRGAAVEPAEVLGQVLLHPAYLAAVLVVLVLAGRRIVARLEDADID